MLTTLEPASRRTVIGAREAAKTLGSPTLEAEHLLLAVADRADTPAHRALADSGLDHGTVLEALAAEFAGSLAGVGVDLDDFALTSTPGPPRDPRMATSAKLALRRAHELARDGGVRRITDGHVLLGVLVAPVGTVPRLLRHADVDREELVRRVTATL